MIQRIAIDMSAPVELNLILRAGCGGVLEVTITAGGVPVNITGANARYEAALSTPIVKTVGAGIALTDPLNGVLEIRFDDTDTSMQNVGQQREHELHVQPVGQPVLCVFEGQCKLEQAVFVGV